jgi:hypothetical protein
VKLDPLLSQYLYNNKQLNLQGIGSFTMDQGFALPAPIENKKNEAVRLEGISFTYNINEQEDAGLIEYIIKETGKIKPLASADLDSYLSVARQFINIGKPFYIEGIGTINKSKDGTYDFTAGNFVAPRLEEHALKPNRQLAEREQVAPSYNSASDASHKSVNTANAKKAATIGIGVLLLGGLAFGSWWMYKNYFSGKKEITDPVVVTENKSVVKDTSQVNSGVDTSTIKKDTTTNLPISPVVTPTPAPITGMINYKVIVKTYYTTPAAVVSFNKLKSYGLNVGLDTNQATSKRIFVNIQSAAMDTLRIKDSLRRYYNPNQTVGKVYIEY